MSIYTNGRIILNQLVQHIQKEMNFTIHYWGENDTHYSTECHHHAFFEVNYVLKAQGNCYYVEGDDMYPLHSNTLFISRPHRPHQIVSDKGLHLLYVAFDVQTKQGFLEQLLNGQSVHTFDEENAVGLLWKSLLHIANTPQLLHYDTQLHDTAYALLCLLLNTYLQQPLHEQRDIMYHDIVTRAIHYIDCHLHTPLKLSDVAQQLHVSERHLSRLFKEQTKIVYSDYVRQQKVYYAAKLLRETNAPIKEVAEAAGFASIHYFTKVFKTCMRETPRDFRHIYLATKNTSIRDTAIG